MKNFVIFVLLYLMIRAGYSESRQTLAVLYFENNSLSRKDELDPLRKGLADMFISELSKIEQFQVVERIQLQKIIEEMKLGQSGILDTRSAAEVGKMLGARYLLLGSFMHMLDGQMRIDVRIVTVETGVTVKAEEMTGKPKDLHKLIQKLVIKISDNLNIKLSKAETQQLGKVENTSFTAALYYAKGLEYEDAGDTPHAIQMYQKALLENANYGKARERLQALKQK